MIIDNKIDNGKGFDWGKASADYAKYRDIYPDKLYDKILHLGLCNKNQCVLDLGTGTGVLPRCLYHYGARFIGVDISEEQINQAKLLSKNKDIEFLCSPSESISFPDNSFDVVTACQCFFYFDHGVLAPKLNKILKVKGKLAVIYMAWLPNEDKIAEESEALVLKYNPKWSGCNETRREIDIPDIYKKYFKVEHTEIFDVKIPFTRESWNGRIKACRGIGASLEKSELEQFEKEHIEVLKYFPKKFEILHYCSIKILSSLKI